MTTMNRRRFFRNSLAPAAPRPEKESSSIALPTFSGSGLAPYAGSWTRQEAGHLLRRTTFGAPYAMVGEAVDMGMDATVDQLLADQPLPDPPLTTSTRDGGSAVGETWVDKPYGDDLTASQFSRLINLSAWLTELMYQEGMSVRESMTLFWHNHFAINVFVEPKYAYRNVATLRAHALGDFRQLVKDITIDPLMLAFLNGNENTVEAPNENYARELMELFTIGKGPQVGPGDYTNYTEDDVVAMARLLTGWRNFGALQRSTDGSFGSVFRPFRHDNSTVTLSHRFGNRQVASSGEDTYADLVDIILEQEEVARFIVRKIYRWFVYYEISEQTEAEVIEPLAAVFRDNDYDVKSVLSVLFRSEHFFDVLSQGPMIKHPVDFTVGLFRQLEIPVVGNPRQREQLYVGIINYADSIGMRYFDPPSVAGWKAFYQEPLYYRTWINSTTLPRRQELSQALLATNLNIRGYGPVSFRLLDIVEQFPEPGSLWPMIEGWTQLLLPRPITEGQREFLKDVLLPGLPDTQWAVEWADYQSNPDDEAIAQALENKLRAMVLSMLEMPEYQLS
ncbi:DUF1800 family protein [Lewinella sp. W8]|uniref:DUF1800 domain-containing protein n=1 Tax=Lewinella sp. W8 TaxID=2528208 RepID=UPI0010685A55|nr:DUF1800 domain-containing protein [Lewinella sp. W8]MTB52756.1 DUF1800 family protein [Lewinella sp. W8]